MQRVTFLLIPLVFASAALAHDGVKDPTVMKRMKAMEQSASALKVLGQIAKGQRAYDAALAVRTQKALVAASGATATLFKSQATDPKSEALPAIWQNWSDFQKRAKASNRAAKALDASSAGTIGAGLGAIGQTCSGCHELYRQKN